LIDKAALTLTGVHMQLSTGSDGSYRSPPVPPDSYTIEVSAGGHVTVQTTVVVQEGVPTTDVNFTLDLTLPFTVLGTVSDPRRAPIPGVTLTLIQNSFPDTRISAVTDSAGNYRLSMDPGIYTGDYAIVANHPRLHRWSAGPHDPQRCDPAGELRPGRIGVADRHGHRRQ
jgi:hypothetical protein